MTRIATSLPYTELEVATGNFDTSRALIDRVIIHTMVGTWQGAAARFDNPASQVSAHYGVKLDGTLIHWLEEYNTAYHAGDYVMNQRSIGIEHEDGWSGPPQPEPIRPDALYMQSAKLVRDICLFYNIPIDRQHILKHNEVSDKPTGCPDSLDIERIVKEAANPFDDCQKQLSQANTVADQNRIGRDTNWNLYQTTLTQLTQAKTTTDNLNQIINDRNNNITKLNSNIDTLNQQVLALITQRDGAVEQAKKLPDMQKQLDQAVVDRQNAYADADSLRRANAQLRNSSVATVPSSRLVGEIVNRVFHLNS